MFGLSLVFLIQYFLFQIVFHSVVTRHFIKVFQCKKTFYFGTQALCIEVQLEYLRYSSKFYNLLLYESHRSPHHQNFQRSDQKYSRVLPVPFHVCLHGTDHHKILLKSVDLCKFTTCCPDVLADKLHPRLDVKILSRKVRLIMPVFIVSDASIGIMQSPSHW